MLALDVFVEISIILVIATLVAGLMRILKQPLIIGYIIAGLLLSPFFLDVIKFMDFLPTKFTVIDDSDVTIRLADDKKYISLWIRNQSLAKSMKNYFESLWKQAS